MNFYKVFTAIIGLCSIASFAQPKSAEDIKTFVWKNEALSYSLPNIPEKWHKESAVVFTDHQDHYYNKTSKSLDNFFVTRRVIKLQDKAAIERFSEFKYPSFVIDGFKEIKTWLGIRIIKPDGTVKEIDVEKEKVKTSSDRSAYAYGFIRVNMKSDQIYKLAIPELEIGDTIDYYIYTYEEYRTDGSYCMQPVETTLSGEYPTMDFRIKLKVENDFFINFNSFNGAPELKDITPEKQRDKEYEITAKNLDKTNLERWVYPLVQYSSYKYQICFAKSGRHEKNTFAFLPEKEDLIKKVVTPEEIQKEYEYAFYYAQDANKDLKKYFKKKELSKEELVKQSYYYMRHFYFNQYMEVIVADRNKLTDMYSPYLLYNNPIFLTYDVEFIKKYGYFLKKNKIPFDIILGKKRFDGDVDDLLIRKNLFWGIRVNLDTPVYIFPFKNHTMINTIPSSMENNLVYLLKLDEKSVYIKINEVEKITLPSSSYKENNSKEISSILFEEGFDAIKVTRVSQHKGHNKMGQYSSRLNYLDYLPEERLQYGTFPFAELMGKKTKAKYDEKNSAFIEKFKKEQLEAFEKDTETEFGFEIDDYQFDIEKTARYQMNAPFVFKESYTINNDLIKRAGPNYIFEAGKLIGGQIEIDEKAKNRDTDVYMSYARSFDNEINITIPEGYSVSGLEKFNINIENETGGFVSEAKVTDNTLTISTNKFYKNNYEPNSNWTKMLEFLEASYQFTQEKILFKKK